MYQDITKVGNPIIVAGVFLHRRQTRVVFRGFTHLLDMALEDLGESLRETPLFETDGCSVFGPVLEKWMPLGLHGLDRNHFEQNIIKAIKNAKLPNWQSVKRQMMSWLRETLYKETSKAEASAKFDAVCTSN